MTIFLSLLGIIASFALIKYREQAGDMIGEADWMLKVGGVYNVMIILAILIFLWSVSAITGTQEIFLGWFLDLLGVRHGPQPQPQPSL